MSKVFIFIPTLNESGNLPQLVEGILKHLPESNLFFVDDGSTDGTRELILEYEKKYSHIHHLFRDTRGRGTAERDGFIEILKHDPDYIIEMDADLSHDPADLPRFLEAIDGADMVIGSRLDEKADQKSRVWHRQVLTLLANLYVRSVFRFPVRDYTSGYRCLRADKLRQVPLSNLISRNMSVLEEVLYIFCRLGFRVKEIPIVFHERRFGETKLTLRDLFEILVQVLRIRSRWRNISL